MRSEEELQLGAQLVVTLAGRVEKGIHLPVRLVRRGMEDFLDRLEPRRGHTRPVFEGDSESTGISPRGAIPNRARPWQIPSRAAP